MWKRICVEFPLEVLEKAEEICRLRRREEFVRRGKRWRRRNVPAIIEPGVEELKVVEGDRRRDVLGGRRGVGMRGRHDGPRASAGLPVRALRHATTGR